MKLIQAMKQVKDAMVKANDLKQKIALNCAHQSIETPTYGTRQRAQVEEWIQSYSDLCKGILSLRFAIQRTNILTSVTIEIGGKQITKTIAEWIHRRRDLAKMEGEVWACLTDKGLRTGQGKNSMGEIVKVDIVLNFDPKTRDEKMELFRSEPSIIDSHLETVNAITDLIEK